MKHVVITAGPVYGRLDDNKLVSNRVRGIWALRFAGYLSSKGYQVTLVLSDTMPKNSALDIGTYSSTGLAIRIQRHTGFESYQKICKELAAQADAMVMAAAVVNWIPAEPIKGKMETKGYQEHDRISIEFELAPRVINQMKAVNPKLTLIGCKMLIGAEHEDLIDAAHHVLLTARCNAVVANDMEHGLKTKYIVHKDRACITYQNFDKFYADLTAIIEDEYYQTTNTRTLSTQRAKEIFDHIADEYRDRFCPVGNRVFGALAVRVSGIGWLVSPREKGQMFSSDDAVLVEKISQHSHSVYVHGPGKATLNAPLLIRVGERFDAQVVLHLHEQLPNTVSVSHAPPGTVRDNERDIPGPQFNIEHHGFIKCLPVKSE